jgi:hypothetical protein
MSFKKVLPFALTGLITMAAACGDDDETTGPGGDTPTVVEVQNMMTALSTALSAALSNAGAAGIAAQTQNIPFNATGSCPNGGTSSVSGNYVATSQSSFHYTLTQSFNQCAAPGGGTIYTFNGTGLTTDAVYNLSGNSISYEFSQTGNLSWSGGGKSATCAVNWNVDLVYNQTTGGYTYDYGGTYCGVSIQ